MTTSDLCQQVAAPAAAPELSVVIKPYVMKAIIKTTVI